jgi:hypothetical protein
MICVLSSIAEWPERVKKLFITEELNEEGIVAMRVFIRGRPEIITIDDRTPWGSVTPLFLHAKGDDRSYWAALAEKAFAKINVNYEHTGWGWMAEGFNTFSGAPTVMFGQEFSV